MTREDQKTIVRAMLVKFIETNGAGGCCATEHSAPYTRLADYLGDELAIIQDVRAKKQAASKIASDAREVFDAENNRADDLVMAARIQCRHWLTTHHTGHESSDSYTDCNICGAIMP